MCVCVGEGGGLTCLNICIYLYSMLIVQIVVQCYVTRPASGELKKSCFKDEQHQALCVCVC